MTSQVKVDPTELRDRCREALLKAEVPPEQAELALDVLVTADLQGISTHGTVRLIAYIKRIKAGLINPRPNIRVQVLAPAARLVDGDDGLGPVVGMTGLNEAVRTARETGACFVGCRRSNHFGPGAPYALEACRQGIIVLGGTNAFPTMAPIGGRDTIVGNNPIFVGVPRRDAPHFILDIAMSAAARGKLRQAAERGETIPAGWALDEDGRPTTDPLEGLKGFVLPVGGHKGYGLALAVDLLAGVLAGAGFGGGVLSLFQQWEKPQNAGHFFFAIDPAVFMPPDEFYRRCDSLFSELKNSNQIDRRKAILYPGEIEAAAYDRAMESGITMDRSAWDSLGKLAIGEYDIEVPSR